MAYITLPDETLPGISGLFAFRPETAVPLRLLAETLLRGDSTLTSAERELIASHVSYLNDCHFCHMSHGAAAVAHLGYDIAMIDDIKNGFQRIEITPKLYVLLHIAGCVQRGGKNVSAEDIEAARQLGATDREIHDTVLIAASFCMFNRYVDGLGTSAPTENSAYKAMGERMAFQGYIPK